jgi:hypothetical protein
MSMVEPMQREVLPEPLGVRQVVRTERQDWQKLGRAAGELEIGYGADGNPVRVEYHWIRYFSRSNPALDDVYTAELWARHAAGFWLYLLRPTRQSFVTVEHDVLRPLLARHLSIDIGD